jgi:hypothetical protein
MPSRVASAVRSSLFSTTAAAETVNGGGDATLFIGCTTRQYDNYDVVTVDLDDSRDYPIYIGTSFSNEQGREDHVFYTVSFLLSRY